MKNKTIKAVVAALILTMTFTACGNTETVSEPQAVEDSTATENVVENTTDIEETVIETVEESVDVTEEVATEEESSGAEESVVEESQEETAAVEESAEEVVEEPVEEAVVYTYTDMTATKFAKSSVNVRDLPSKDGNKIGSLSTNTEVAVTGKCNETGWFRFELNGQTAYVSNAYLVDEKVVIEEKPVAAAPAADFEFYKWYDKGAYMIAYVPHDDSCPEEWRGYIAPGFDDALATITARYAGTDRDHVSKSIWYYKGNKNILIYSVEAARWNEKGELVFFTDGAACNEAATKGMKFVN